MELEYRAAAGLQAQGRTLTGYAAVYGLQTRIGDFNEVIRPGEDPLLIVISTQAANDGDLLSIWLDDARASNDPHTVCHLYAAPAGCELLDVEGWKAANPALGEFRSEQDLREQMQQAQRMPSMENSVRNLLLNQRVSTESPFISPDVWKACSATVLPFDGPVWAGLDLSARLDLTAFVLIGKAGDVWQVVPTFWTPEKGLQDRAHRDRAPYDVWHRQGLLKATPGASVDYEHVARDILDLVADLDLRAVAFDRWRMDVLKRELDQLGADLPLVPWGQGFKDMSPALDALEAELLNQRVAHGGNPVLTMCAANATTTKDPAGGRKLDKSRNTGRIDGLQALAMAFGVATREQEAQTYASNEFLFV